MTLVILLILSGLVLALLSVSGFEPQISTNHGQTVRARYVAEAGVEYAYDTLATIRTPGTAARRCYVRSGGDPRRADLESSRARQRPRDVHGQDPQRLQPGRRAAHGESVDNDHGSVRRRGRRRRDPRRQLQGHRHLHGLHRNHHSDDQRRGLEDRVPAATARLAFPGFQADVNVPTRASRSTDATRGWPIVPARRRARPRRSTASPSTAPSSSRRPSRDSADGQPAERRPRKG